jgi:protein-L-isoaspartate(D-aspartate) O-methyltransferase
MRRILAKELDIQGRGMTSQRTRNRLVMRLQQQGIRNPYVLDILQRVPRHLFVDEALASRAYEDSSLPIGHGQTISQPYIVARMTELLLSNNRPENVLEVGTGSGYQAAVLGALVKKLHSIEIIPQLYQNAQDLLYTLGYRNIHLHRSDGSWGWKNAAPYDAIIATAAPEKIPDSLLQQLSIGGTLVIPVGTQGSPQSLQSIQRLSKTDYQTTLHESVHFVPFTYQSQK